MKITVMGLLIVIGGILLLALVVYGVKSNLDQTGKDDEQPNLPT